MPTAKGTITQFYQYKDGRGGGKKAPAKIVLDVGGDQTEEFKSWSIVQGVEIGQVVEITYETQVANGYTNHNIMEIKHMSEAGYSPKGGGGTGNDRNVSIEKQVCLKVAGEVACAVIAASGGKGITPEGIEDTLQRIYQASFNLLTYGTTDKDIFADE